jgi:glycosyltransferase involved in cell wall biosynthesis
MAAVLKSRAQVVHTFLTQMDIIGGAVALAARRKWILSERLSTSGYGSGPKDRLRRLLGKHSDLLIANSESGLEAWPTCRERRVIPNGIEVDVIDAAPAMPAMGRPTLISVARLQAAKRIDRLLRALPQLRSRVPDILLVLLGKGPEEGKLRKLARSLSVESHVLFAGHRTDPWPWVKGADVFLSASSVEGHPNAVLEAAVAGTPLILSDIRTHREAVGDDGALFVDADDGEAMTKAVLSILTDQAGARSRAASARKATQDLCADKTADTYAGAYRELINGLRPGASPLLTRTPISGLGSSPG